MFPKQRGAFFFFMIQAIEFGGKKVNTNEARFIVKTSRVFSVQLKRQNTTEILWNSLAVFCARIQALAIYALRT